MLLPRRFSYISSNGSALKTAPEALCSAFVDEYIATIEKNHLYMEQSLQTGYTAAFYFLFQNAVQQQSRNITDAEAQASSFPQLAFAGNLQLTNVQVSILLPNAIISLVGCVLLLVVSLGVVVRAKRSEYALQENANADTILEAMVDSSKYPPSLIDIALNQVAISEEEEDIQILLNELRVQKVTLQHHRDARHVFHLSLEI